MSRYWVTVIDSVCKCRVQQTIKLIRRDSHCVNLSEFSKIIGSFQKIIKSCRKIIKSFWKIVRVTPLELIHKSSIFLVDHPRLWSELKLRVRSFEFLMSFRFCFAAFCHGILRYSIDKIFNELQKKKLKCDLYVRDQNRS